MVDGLKNKTNTMKGVFIIGRKEKVQKLYRMYKDKRFVAYLDLDIRKVAFKNY